ncbi:MAG: hypothetical protein MK486_20965, partial [Gemmatimonadetes bacterium]|nr:hypothetical protein [Gemmatimonadota bacterium]
HVRLERVESAPEYCSEVTPHATQRHEVPGASPISLSAYRSCRDESLYAAFANEGAHVVVPERSPTFRAMSCAVCQTRLTGILRHQTGRLHRVHRMTHDAHPGL